jgi:hypothetical protein
MSNVPFISAVRKSSLTLRWQCWLHDKIQQSFKCRSETYHEPKKLHDFIEKKWKMTSIIGPTRCTINFQLFTLIVPTCFKHLFAHHQEALYTKLVYFVHIMSAGYYQGLSGTLTIPIYYDAQSTKH